MTEAINLDLIMLNKIIVNYTNDFNSLFLSNNTQYGVTVDKVGFSYPHMAALFVNRWADRASIKRITDVLEPKDINNKSSILLVNGAYLKSTWELPFDIKQTKIMKFHHHDGNSSLVPMMKKTDSCLYLNDAISGFKFANMKLAMFGLSMTIAVTSRPSELVRLIYLLSHQPDTLSRIHNSMSYELVNVMLPRFKIKTCIELSKYLQKIGLNRVFNESNSGLNGILSANSEAKKMYISKVKQKIFIDVDETGVFRQTINNDFHLPRAQQNVNGLEVTANQPFLFTINVQSDINRKDLHQLFTGVYYGPNY